MRSIKVILTHYNDNPRFLGLLGWRQSDEQCWSNNVGGQKLNHLTSHLNSVETCPISMIIQNLYFGFCQTFQPTNLLVMTFTEIACHKRAARVAAEFKKL